MISIYTFIDYRQYLCKLFEFLRQEDPLVSYRSFARMAGSSSPNFLQLIRDRKLNISTRSLSVLARSLKLTKKEEEYLNTIVAFDHAKTHLEKDGFFQKVLQIRGYNNAVELQKEQYDFYSHWYIPVIRELITCKDYPDDPQWIADRIVPSVTVAMVRKGIELLQKLDLVRPQEKGMPWLQTHRTISTPSEVLSVAVVKYHMSTIKLGMESITRFGPDRRDVRSIIIGLPKDKVDGIRSRIEGFWSELLAYADQQENVEEVVQVNIQMFPMSKEADE